MLPFTLSFAFLFALDAIAVPAHVPRTRVSSVTNLTPSQLEALAPYTQFARAAYCPTAVVRSWACGGACRAVPDFRISVAGGDGIAIQFYYVGYWPSANSVVVAHQGTDPTHLLPILTDANIILKTLNSTLFPGIDTSARVHSGFANAHEKTAAIVLDQVTALISSHRATSVTLVGHSLGGALAELDCMFMALHLPPNIAIKGVTYGTPRVGNAAWAALFDTTISDFQRINNQKDVVPIVPGRFMGFSHVTGEVHIIQPNNAVQCPGSDNTNDARCTVMTVPNLTAGHIPDHMGPYQGISIGSIYCT